MNPKKLRKKVYYPLVLEVLRVRAEGGTLGAVLTNMISKAEAKRALKVLRAAEKEVEATLKELREDPPCEACPHTASDHDIEDAEGDHSGCDVCSCTVSLDFIVDAWRAEVGDDG